MIEDSYPTLIVIMLTIQQTVVVSNGGFILMAQDGTRTTPFILFAKVYYIFKNQRTFSYLRYQLESILNYLTTFNVSDLKEPKLHKSEPGNAKSVPQRENNVILLKVRSHEREENTTSLATQKGQYKIFRTMLDTGNSMRYPLITSRVYEELKNIIVLSEVQTFENSNTSVQALDNHIYTIEELILQSPIIFLTDSGSEIAFDRFYVQPAMLSDINIGKYSLSRLEIKWDLQKNYVYFGKSKIKLYPRL